MNYANPPTSPIDTSSLRYLLGIASWQSILAWILISLAFVVYFLYSKKKKSPGKNFFTFAFLLGILVGLIFFIVYSLTKTTVENPFPDDPTYTWVTWEEETKSVLSLLTTVYFSLLITIIPLLILTALIVVINKGRHNSKINSKAFFISFFSLLLMAVIGITVALLITPLIKLIDLPASENDLSIDSSISNSSIPDIINSAVPSSLAVFTNVNLILAIVFIGLFLGFVLQSLHRRHHTHGEKIISFFERLQMIIMNYIKLVSFLLPYVIISRIPIMFIGDFLQNLFNLLFFFAIFLFGWFIINVIESGVAIGSMKKSKEQKTSNTKLFFGTIRPYWVEALTKVNSSSLLPYTIDTSLKLNADKEMGYFTPTLATTMGQSICAAFYPTFIAVMTANLVGVDMNVSFFFILIIIVLVTNIGVTGIPGADSTLNLIVLGTLGLPSTYYVNILLVEPFLDSIRTLGNATGFVAATLLSSRLNKYFN